MFKQAFGNIIKKEQLESINVSFENDAMLLVASNPFPGYKGMVEKNYYYLVLHISTKIDCDELIELIQNVLSSLPVQLDVFPCEINVYNKLYKAIRIYGEAFENIHKFISQLRLYGINFQKNQIVKPYISQIKVIKFFELAEVDQGIYKSVSTPEFKYIQIPRKIDWEEFEYLVGRVNQNEMYMNCDFAMASFHSKEGFDYYLRIFSDSCTVDKLLGFKALVLDILEQLSIK